MTIDEGRKPEGAPERAPKAGEGAPSRVDGNGPKRFSVERKMAIVARLLRGEPLELVGRETNVSVARLTEWRERALAGAASALKERERDERDDEIAQIESSTDKANKIVRNYTLASVIVGAVPLPVVDLVALSGLQLKMLHSLARVYNVEFSEQLGKSLIGSLLGGGIPLSFSSNLARLVKSLVKSVPIYGSAAGMISVAVFGGASTYAIGKVFMQHFESGGTFLDFDPQRVRDYYAKQFQAGKEEVKSVVGTKP